MDRTPCPEIALKAELEKFKKFINIAGVIILQLDKEGNIVLINQEGAKLLGYKESELLGRNWFSGFLPARSKDEIFAVFKQLMAGNISSDEFHENYIVAKDGSEKCILWRNALLYDEHSAITGTLSSGSDITKIKNAMHELNKAKLEQEALLNNLPDIAWLKDKNGVFLAVNEPFAKFCGKERSAIQGKTDYEIWPNEIAEKNINNDIAVIKSQNRAVFDEPLTDGAGCGYIVETVKTPIKGEDGSIIGTTGISRDITNQKKAEQEKQKIIEQLIQSEKLASLGQMAAGIAHELNTPINVMLGYVELLKNKLSSNQQYNEYLDIILEEIEFCKQLISDFMFYARPLSENESVPENINLVGALNNALKLLNVKNDSQIKLETDLGQSLPKIRGSKKLVTQLFINLISNSLHAMPQGGTIKISATQLPQADKLLLTISDNGQGIPKEKLIRVFDPFFTTKRPGKGNGLGLSICQRIVESMNGCIKVESEENKGTVVCCEFPVVKG